MKRVMTMAITAISLLAVAGAPAFATTAKHTKHHVTCKQIKDALDGGKSSEDVQKDLHVTEARVKACTTSTAKKAKTPPPAEPKS
jgi:hypothetical protein